MSSLPCPSLYNPSTQSHLIPQMSSLHAACIIHDGMPATILNPIGSENEAKMTRYWNEKHQQAIDGTRLIVLQFSDDTEKTLAGIVMLHMPWTETGPFRSEVEKLCVDPKFRNRGIARRLMRKLEDEAGRRGRGLIMLDTTIGLAAEHVYPKLGYIPIGIVPKYAISPADGKTLMDELYFYKDLRDPGCIKA
ncbi:Acetyltransferase [Pseudocercospora fuligena]|uniref:Acetyltransferase n=1 Tax=Pseudocercospora fuligena TaxID=685502 RepID=A0A8H6RTT1_9PEZI|nr:Acetyltransferase [Pseudocercospora fuligena]